MTKRIVITSGLALFAMFFGAGNIIFPLALGAQAGNHIVYVALAFLISGIGLPLLGLFATSLYHGNYWEFFNRLGKIPAFFVVTFLILIIGPLFAAPRTETVTFHTLQPFLPAGIDNPLVFSALYCGVIFLLTFRDTKVVDIIGRVLSPIKLSLFLVLIVAGLWGTHEIIENKHTISYAFKNGLVNGYSTMDLLATFFFCSVICKDIFAKTRASGITSSGAVTKIFLQSCVVAGVLLGLVYIGFMLLALFHASQLQGVETAQMIVAISNLVLGKFGSLFVGVCVAFACIVTATALTEVTTSFFYEQIFKRKVPRMVCLIGTITFIYLMTIIGFSGIMKLASPLLEILYPALIIFCVINISLKLVSFRNKSTVEQAV